MIKTMFVAVLAMLSSLAVYLYFHLGVAKPVEIEQQTRGPMHLLFKPHMGAYHKLSVVISEVESWAQSHNIPCPQTFGEYLDNPQTMDEDRLRSRGGCILTASPENPPQEYEYQLRGSRSYVVARFTGSPAIGPFKVYPKVQEYLEEHRLKSTSPVIEIYTVNGQNVTTEYLFAIDPVASQSALTE